MTSTTPTGESLDPKRQASPPVLGRREGTRTARERQRRLARYARGVALVLGIAALAGGAFWALQPRAVEVDVVRAARAPLTLVIEESGVTRVKDQFVVSAPVAGTLSRLSLEPGDEVKEGQPLAELAPVSSPLLDERTRRAAEARLDAATAALGQAGAQLARATTAQQLALQELTRAQQLVARGSLPTQALEQAEFAARMREQELSSAVFAEKIAKEELRGARAALGEGPPGARDRHVSVLAPASGQVLRVFRKSAGVVEAGAQLVELGNPEALEVVVDLLTTDAVLVSPGTSAELQGWGGAPLHGKVSRVEPSGFTRPSALGVDEQRVNVVITLLSPRSEWARLGDGYRVEARLTLWQSDAALQVPSGSVFRHEQGWAVFRLRAGKAELVPITTGHRGETALEVLSGLQPGDEVVVHPSDRVQAGVRVAPR